MPPLIAVTLAAALVRVMTGTASPFCSPRAHAKKAITEASTQVASHGEISPATPMSPTAPVSALIATSETPKRMPAAMPSMTPWCSCEPSLGDSTRNVPSASRADSNAIMPASE